MSRSALLIDVGASRIKIQLAQDLKPIFELDTSSPTLLRRNDGAVTTDTSLHAEIIRNLSNKIVMETGIIPDAIYMCSEMGGFQLADDNGIALTPYISWQDERAIRSGVLELLEDRHRDSFRRKSGLRLKAGLPLVSIAHLSSRNELPASSWMLDLPASIVNRLGRATGVMNETMASVTGFYDVNSKEWSQDLLALAGVDDRQLRLPRIALPEATHVGEISLSGHGIPVFGGLGDLQAAVLGSGAVAVTDINVNIGTGSQVNYIDGPDVETAEIRPFLDNKEITTISHIPAGRALSDFERFFTEWGGSDPRKFWHELERVSADEADESEICLDLNVFGGAWRYRGGGAIYGINEGRFTPSALMVGIVASMAQQYVDAICLVDRFKMAKRLVLSGGLPRRIPALGLLISKRTALELVPLSQGEETLKGLLTLAQRGMQ